MIQSLLLASASITAGIFACIYVAYQRFEAKYSLPPVPPNSRTIKGITQIINPVIPEDVDRLIGAPKIYAVLGGGGFLGSYVVYRLLRTRHIKKIYVLDLGIGPCGWLYEGRPEVEFVKTDITQPESLKKIIAETKAEVVIYTAALVSYFDILPAQYPRSHKVNVEGTVNVLRACEEAPSVKYFVQTSSGAVASGWDVIGGKWWDMNEEEATIAEQPFNHYGTTKKLAEEAVRSWDGRGIRTVSLRPYGIYGYGDSDTVTTFLKGGYYTSNILNWDYVENVAQAMIAAADGLETNPENVGGKAFFICDGLPVDSLKFGQSFHTLRPDIGNLLPLPRIVFFILCAIGDAACRNGINLPGPFKVLNFGTFGSSQLLPTFVNDAALTAIGEWRRWTLEESIGRSVFMWEKHKHFLATKKLE
ncbi:hypothetical protein BJ742DRAFT_900710 [Cladochytrium replicatum]|nr:hypothetical protein BJ742DRAFT_900710 [Cladochytrium replicatum]